MRLLSLGSLNLDHIYTVPHIAHPGETLSSTKHETLPGGKGANQAVALARARTTKIHVAHAGRTGAKAQAECILDTMGKAGVDCTMIEHIDEIDTGTAIIQVSQSNAENAIILFPGANHKIDKPYIDKVLQKYDKGDVILLQNEISESRYVIEAAAKRGLIAVFNPSPITTDILDFPRSLIPILIQNDGEADTIKGHPLSQPLADQLSIITHGEKGASVYRGSTKVMTVPALKVDAVDTTGAGDTFVGYFVTTLCEQLGSGKSFDLNQVTDAMIEHALIRASKAASIAVSKAGAMDSIPQAAMLL